MIKKNGLSYKAIILAFILTLLVGAVIFLSREIPNTRAMVEKKLDINKLL